MTVAYRKRPALWDIDVTIPDKSLVGLIGPNGAGKSTFLKAIMGLLRPLSGYVRVFGDSVEKQRGVIGYVPQRETVDWDFPTNALDVTLMGRYGKMSLFGRPKKADREAALDCLNQVGMANYAHRQISQLSGGQQQRVFLARALAQESKLYLMDEPFAGVDAATEKAIIDILRRLKSEGKTVIVVHHDLHTAPDYFDHLLLLNMRLVSFGKTEEVFTDELLRATYGGRLNLLSAAADRVADPHRKS
ncbi:MAG: metal ABC transporter ATP-binding protein [Candidatus Zixiibacteriota bacterium]